MARCPYCSEPVVATMADEATLTACPVCMSPYWIDGPTQETRPETGVGDLRQTATSGTIGGELLKALPAATENLPILPEVSTRIMELLRDANTSMSDIADTVKQDQAVAVKILQLANSAVYGGLTKITDLTAACARLGSRTIANAVQTVANGNLYITGNQAYKDRMRRLWTHAVATAHCANQLATMTASPRPDALFFAGLIHDIGNVVLLDIVSSRRRGVLAELHQSPDLLSEVLRSYGTIAGLHVVRLWKLPQEFALTTYFHRSPDSVPSEEARTMTHIVCLAEAIADTSGFFASGTPSNLLSHASTKYLGLSDIKMAIIRADLEDAIQPLLEISVH